MKEFIEKLNGRLEEGIFSKDERLEYDTKTQEHLISQNKGIRYAIKIVNELAEEFATDINVVSNNGWIPCSERLPEKEVDVLVCFSNDMDCVIAYRTKMMNTNLKDVWVNSSTAQIISSNIIAWQPLPQPFKEEGASNE